MAECLIFPSTAMFCLEEMNSQGVTGSPLVSISLPQLFPLQKKNTPTGQVKEIRIQISIEVLFVFR